MDSTAVETWIWQEIRHSVWPNTVYWASAPQAGDFWEQMAAAFWEGQGARAFVTLLVRINVGSWHILTFGQGSLKICPIHIPFKGKKTAMNSEICLSSELISGFPSGLEICPAQHSILVKCFTVFTPCHSSAWHAWGPHCCNCSLRAAVPTAVPTAEQLLPSCARRQTASTIVLLVIPQVFSFSILRYSQCHTYLFAIHGADSYYSSTWAHCSFHMGLFERCPT